MASPGSHFGTDSQSPAVSSNSPPALNNSNDQGNLVQVAVNESPPAPGFWNARIDSTNGLNMLTAPPSNSMVENRMNAMANASDKDRCLVATVSASMVSMNASLLNTQAGRYEKIQMKKTANSESPPNPIWMKQIDSNWPVDEVAMNSAVGITSLQVTTFAISDDENAVNPAATRELPPAPMNFVAGNSTNMMEADNLSQEVTRATAISRAGVTLANDIFGRSNFKMDAVRGLRGAGLVTDERQFIWFPNTGFTMSTFAFLIGNDEAKKFSPFAVAINGNSRAGLTLMIGWCNDV